MWGGAKLFPGGLGAGRCIREPTKLGGATGASEGHNSPVLSCRSHFSDLSVLAPLQNPGSALIWSGPQLHVQWLQKLSPRRPQNP